MRLFSLLVPVLALGLAGITTSAAAAVTAPDRHHASSLTSVTATRTAGHMGRGIGTTGGAISNSCPIRNRFFVLIKESVSYGTAVADGTARRADAAAHVPRGSRCGHRR